jgi:tight adherence protein C
VPAGALLATGLGGIGLAIVLLVLAVAPGRSKSEGISAATAVIEQRYAQHGPGQEEQQQLSAPPGWLRELGLKLSPATGIASMQRRLDTAGNPRSWDTDRLLAVKALGLILLGGLGALYTLHNPVFGVPAAILGGAAGFFLPDLLVYNTAIKRQAKLQQALPDAMDMLTICVEAGLGFDAAMARVARNTDGPVGAEFSRVLQEVQIGKSRSQALRSMAERTTVGELRAFVSAIVQASELGIPIADVMRVQAKEMRLRRRQRAEEKAQQVPVKILFPLMGCLFPALFTLVIGPGVISIMHSLFSGSGI